MDCPDDVIKELHGQIDFYKILLSQTATLRDKFAMAALTGFMSIEDGRTYSPERSDCRGLSLKEWRTKAYQFDAQAMYLMADAMMEARKQQPEQSNGFAGKGNSNG